MMKKIKKLSVLFTIVLLVLMTPANLLSQDIEIQV